MEIELSRNIRVRIAATAPKELAYAERHLKVLPSIEPAAQGDVVEMPGPSVSPKFLHL